MKLAPHTAMPQIIIVAGVLVFAFASAVVAQRPREAESQNIIVELPLETTPEIVELRNRVRRNEADADAWYQLGQAYTRLNQFAFAADAFEQAVRLRPRHAASRVGVAFAYLNTNRLNAALREAERALQLEPLSHEARYVAGGVALKKNEFAQALAQADAALKLKPAYAPAHLLKTRALIALATAAPVRSLARGQGLNTDARREQNRQRFAEAVASLENYLRLSSKDARPFQREQLAVLSVYAGEAVRIDNPARTIFYPQEVSTQAVIKRTPAVAYTREARQARIEGTTRLRAVLSSDGTVQHILLLDSLGYGLDEAAIEAARRTEFTPALKDGKPVSQIVNLAFTFNLR